MGPIRKIPQQRWDEVPTDAPGDLFSVHILLLRLHAAARPPSALEGRKKSRISKIQFDASVTRLLVGNSKSTEITRKNTMRNQLFTTPYQNRAVQRLREFGGERTDFGALARPGSAEVSRRTAQILGIFGANPRAENIRPIGTGGRGGIRTLDTLSRMHAFQACALNHSATLP